VVNAEYRGTNQWSRDKQAVFTVVWISFLCAAVGTMVFFALFDPVDLLEIDRNAGYAVGFFFFWVLSLVCSGLTAFLVRTAPKRDTTHRDE
jgi:K+-sensing histidine kinase KdpD